MRDRTILCSRDPLPYPCLEILCLAETTSIIICCRDSGLATDRWSIRRLRVCVEDGSEE